MTKQIQATLPIGHGFFLKCISMTGLLQGEQMSIGANRILAGLLWSIALVAVLFLYGLAEQTDAYTPGSELGYNLGLAGGLMMLTLLLYPVRKRLFPYDRMGSLTGWFRYHMWVGILAPILIMFHARFETASMNGLFAYYAMLAVVFSGIVGRFIHRTVHRGLYGEHMTLDDTLADLQKAVDDLAPLFKEAPHIGDQLRDFQKSAFDPSSSVVLRLTRFIFLPLQGWLLAWRLTRQILIDEEKQQPLTARARKERKKELARVFEYVSAVVKAAHFALYDRLFSFWSMIHIPFLYLLVFSGIIHVVAVHMY